MKMVWLIYPFCSIFIVIGLGISGWTMRGILKGRAVSGWPAADATILECDLNDTGDGEGPSWEVVVKYAYEVDGVAFESSRIHPAYTSSSFDGHESLYNDLKASTVVSVRYKEADPSESYLLSGSFSAHLAGFFGGLIFASAGLFFLLTFHFALVGNSDYASALEVVRPQDPAVED